MIVSGKNKVRGCDIGVEEARTERADLPGELLRDMRIAQMLAVTTPHPVCWVVDCLLLAHHGAVLGLCQCVVVFVPGTGLGELDEQFLQQFGNLVINVLRAVVGMKPRDDKRKLLQQLPDDREQVGLADLLMELLAI